MIRHLPDGFIVCHHDNGVAVLLIDFLNELQNLLAGFVIQCAGRFVAQQKVRVLNNGTADRHPLLLAAGELIRKLVSVIPESQGVQQLINIQRTLREVRSHLNVLLHVQVGDQVVHLKNIPQVSAPVHRQCLFIHILHTVSVDADRSAVRTVNSADNVQQRGFAGPGRPQKNTEFSLLHIKGKPPQHLLPGLSRAKALS